MVRLLGIAAALAISVAAGSTPASAQPGARVKLAFFNIQSGIGEVGLAGRPVLFADTKNCTDRTKPLNAWGVGLVQQELVKSVKNDPAVIALGLGEAWECARPENVLQVLGWTAKTSSRNGVAVVARYGFAGEETWQQLDTSENPNPADTMWVVRVGVCTDAACSASILMYASHWFANGSNKQAVYDKQAQQTLDFMKATAGTAPHVLIGDLNAWEGTSRQCGQNPINAGVARLRSAGYIDAWPRIKGPAEGFTGMTNRRGCGSPAGYTWKRIDYAWSSPGLAPLDITRFGIPAVIGDAAVSDHYGIIATYPAPARPAPKPRGGRRSPRFSGHAIASAPISGPVAGQPHPSGAEAITAVRTLAQPDAANHQVAEWRRSSGLFRSFAERQVPSSKHQIPTHSQPPTSTFHRNWAIGLGSALELGIWSLGFDTRETIDTVH